MNEHGMDFPPEVHSCKAEWTINHTRIKSVWKAFEATRHLWKPWVWLTAFSNNFDGSLNWEISSPILQEFMSKIYFDQPTLACIQQHMRPLCSPVGLCSLVNPCNGHGEARLDFNQTFMTVYLELKTPSNETVMLSNVLIMFWASLRNANIHTGYISLAIISYTQFAGKSKSGTLYLFKEEIE